MTNYAPFIIPMISAWPRVTTHMAKMKHKAVGNGTVDFMFSQSADTSFYSLCGVS